MVAATRADDTRHPLVPRGAGAAAWKENYAFTRGIVSPARGTMITAGNVPPKLGDSLGSI